ncbi:MAG: hypothetical protein AAF488_13695 [Planctomycetota bacterium]
MTSDDGSVGFLLLGNVHLVTDRFELWADRVAVSVAKPPADGDAAAHPLAPEWATKRPFKLYAEGNVILFREEASFRGESLLFDSVAGRAILTEVRARAFFTRGRQPDDLFDASAWSARDIGAGDAGTQRDPFEEDEEDEANDVSSGDIGLGMARTDHHDGGQLIFAARRLELEDFAQLQAEGVEVTTCEFGDPHWAVTAKSASARQIPREPVGYAVDGSPIGPDRSFLFSLQGVRFELWNQTVLPLPSVTWDTYWNQILPIRSVGYTNSSKFGHRGTVVWDGNLLLPKSLTPYVDLGIRTEYLSERGFGYGADLELGTKVRRWSKDPHEFAVYGRGVAYAIRDRGEDVGDIEPEDNDRSRVRYHQRVRFPTSTLLDLELAIERDRNFLEEYYQSELRSQKEPENILYLRHVFGDDYVATILAKKRMVSYRTVVERLPEVTFHIVDAPIGRTGLNFDTVARGSYLRYLPDDVTADNSRRMARGDVVSTLSAAVGSSRYGIVRPFIEVRGTAWEEDRAGTNRIERLSAATGAAIAWHVGRTYRPADPLLGMAKLRHVIQPSVTYRNVFENNVDPMRLFRYDSTEDVRRTEVITFGVRQFVFGRAPRPVAKGGDPSDETIPPPPMAPATRKLLEVETEIDYFPDAGRDNAGTNWGPLRGELLVWPLEGIGAFVDGEYNVENGGRFEEFNAGVTLRAPLHGPTFSSAHRRVEVTVANRFLKRTSHALTLNTRWKISERYEVGAYLEEDLRRHKRVNQIYTITRHFHRWTVGLEVEVDDGEDNVGVHLQFAPRDFFYFTRRR